MSDLNTQVLCLSITSLTLSTTAFGINAIVILSFLFVRSLRKLHLVHIAILCSNTCIQSSGYMIVNSIRLAQIAQSALSVSKLVCVTAAMPVIIGCLLVQFSIVAISIDRFTIILFPGTYNQHKKTLTILLSSTCCILPTLFGFVGFYDVNATELITPCIFTRATRSDWTLAWYIIQVVTPSTAMLLYSISIFANRSKSTELNAGSSRQEKLRKLINALILAFFLITLPAAICRILSLYVKVGNLANLLPLIAGLLQSVNAIANFCIYLKRHAEIQHGVHQFLGQIRTRVSPTHAHSPSNTIVNRMITLH